MKHTLPGRTGLTVGRLCLGTMKFSRTTEKRTLSASRTARMNTA